VTSFNLPSTRHRKKILDFGLRSIRGFYCGGQVENENYFTKKTNCRGLASHKKDRINRTLKYNPHLDFMRGKTRKKRKDGWPKAAKKPYATLSAHSFQGAREVLDIAVLPEVSELVMIGRVSNKWKGFRGEKVSQDKKLFMHQADRKRNKSGEGGC